jgi:tripartite-type tricarboxylate transporter receptor subunit TctC
MEGPHVNAQQLLLCAAACAAITLDAAAQTPPWPSRPLRIIAAQSPGGVTDMLARTLAQKFSETWKQPAVVENRAGAAGAIGTEVAVKAPPDGYTLLLSSSGPIVINPGLYPKLGYDPLRDLTPIAFVAASPLMLVVHPSVPANSVKALIALARAQPERLSYGSGGNGSPAHLTAELFKATTGTRITHIPFKGSAPSVLALVGGQIDLSFTTIVISIPQVKGGRLRALAVTSPQRSRAVPTLPTMIEAGVAGFESQQWFGLFGPAAMPKELVTRLHDETVRIMEGAELRERLASDGGEPAAMTTEQFAAFIRADAARWTQVIRASGATAD